MDIQKKVFDNIRPGEQFVIREYKAQYPQFIRAFKITRDDGSLSYRIETPEPTILTHIEKRIGELRTTQDKLEELLKK